MSSLGERIATLRHEQEMSVRELARLAQVDHAWISRLESGEKTNISLMKARDIAWSLGVSLDYLVGDTPNPERWGRVHREPIEVGV